MAKKAAPGEYVEYERDLIIHALVGIRTVCHMTPIELNVSIRWEAFFGSAMDADDELSDTSRLRIDIPPVPENPPPSNRRETPLPESETHVVGRVKEDGEVHSRRQAARSVQAPPSPASPRGNQSSVNRRGTALPPPVVERAGQGEESDSAGEFEPEEGWEEMFVYKVGGQDAGCRS